MLEYLISAADVICLAGCVYVAYLAIVHLNVFKPTATRRREKATQLPETGEQPQRSPCLGYYI